MSERARVVTTTNAQKLAALDRVARGEPLKTVAQQLKVSRQTLWRWANQRELIEEAPPDRVFVGEKKPLTLLPVFVEKRYFASVFS